VAVAARRFTEIDRPRDFCFRGRARPIPTPHRPDDIPLRRAGSAQYPAGMRPAPTPLLLWKKSCDTCRRFKAGLEAAGAVFEDREINARPLTAAEIDVLIGEDPHEGFLNPRNELYRERGMSKVKPARAEAIALIAGHNNLLRRPVLVVGDTVLAGNDLPLALKRLGLS
jgi:arsenate reductase-like glutaredoxin family protein